MQSSLFICCLFLASQLTASVRIDDAADQPEQQVKKSGSAMPRDPQPSSQAPPQIPQGIADWAGQKSSEAACKSSAKTAATVLDGGTKETQEAKKAATHSYQVSVRAGELEAMASTIGGSYEKAKQRADEAAKDAAAEAKKAAATMAHSKLEEEKAVKDLNSGKKLVAKELEAEKVATKAREDADTHHAKCMADDDVAKQEEKAAIALANKTAEESRIAEDDALKARKIKKEAILQAQATAAAVKSTTEAAHKLEAQKNTLSKKARLVFRSKVVVDKIAKETEAAKTLATQKLAAVKAQKESADTAQRQAGASAEHAQTEARRTAEDSNAKTAAAFAALKEKQDTEVEAAKETLVSDALSTKAVQENSSKQQGQVEVKVDEEA